MEQKSEEHISNWLKSRLTKIVRQRVKISLSLILKWAEIEVYSLIAEIVLKLLFSYTIWGYTVHFFPQTYESRCIWSTKVHNFPLHLRLMLFFFIFYLKFLLYIIFIFIFYYKTHSEYQSRWTNKYLWRKYKCALNSCWYAHKDT